MKITLEFTDVEKFFVELPRFAALMSMAGKFTSFDKVKAQGLEVLLQEPNLPQVGITADGEKVAVGDPEQVGKLKDAQDKALEAVKAMTQEPAMNPPETDENEPEEEKPKKDTTKEKKAAEGQTGAPVKDTDVRKMLNRLIKAGHRDKVKEILSEFGAPNFSKLDSKHYEAVMEKGREILEGGSDE